MSPQDLPVLNEQESDPRIGVYVCRCGGNISDVIDVERVAETVSHYHGVEMAKVHTFMCSDPGQQMIAEDIRKEKLNRIIVASCSPFLHEMTFRTAVNRGGLNPFLYEHVNIREQGSWAHHDDPEGATLQAIRMISAAIGKLRHVKPLDTIRMSNHRKALVIGGGIAGLKAAADLAHKGIPVVLIEKTGRLGGQVAGVDSLYPTEISGAELVQTLVDEVREHPLVKIIGHAQLADVSGFKGNFDITITRDGNADAEDAEGWPIPEDDTPSETKTAVGAIILATGFRSYEPREGELGYRKSPAVMTLPEYTRWLPRQTGRKLTLDGRTVRSVAFIHCVGSRQVAGVHEPQEDGNVNDYCSRFCCTAILQQALHTRRRFPETQVYELYQDIRAYGRGHEEYYTDASEAGVTFLRYHAEEPPTVEIDKRGLRVTVKDWLTWGEEIEVPVDLLVLGTGMMPGAIQNIIEKMKLPVGVDRFLQEVHPKLAPVELAVSGVFVAGTSQGPMTALESLEAASAAAVKASALLSSDFVEIDPFVAKVNPELCTGCEKCIPECAYTGALIMKDIEGAEGSRRVAEVNPGLCTGCGACVPVCPTRALDVQGWTLEQFEAMVDGLVEAAADGAEKGAES